MGLNKHNKNIAEWTPCAEICPLVLAVVEKRMLSPTVGSARNIIRLGALTLTLSKLSLQNMQFLVGKRQRSHPWLFQVALLLAQISCHKDNWIAFHFPHQQHITERVYSLISVYNRDS